MVDTTGASVGLSRCARQQQKTVGWSKIYNFSLFNFLRNAWRLLISYVLGSMTDPPWIHTTWENLRHPKQDWSKPITSIALRISSFTFKIEKSGDPRFDPRQSTSPCWLNSKSNVLIGQDLAFQPLYYALRCKEAPDLDRPFLGQRHHAQHIALATINHNYINRQSALSLTPLIAPRSAILNDSAKASLYTRWFSRGEAFATSTAAIESERQQLSANTLRRYGWDSRK